MSYDSKNIVFFSSCTEAWGGSEELWSQAAELLAQNSSENYRIHIFKKIIDWTHPRVKRLLELDCRITDLNEIIPHLPRKLWNRIMPFHPKNKLENYIKTVFTEEVQRLNPKLLVVSQGINFDGLFMIEGIQLDEIPYVLISQKATDNVWVCDGDREWMKKLWQGAENSFFVSEHNLKLTEEQFGLKFEHAEVVRNPFLTKTKEPLPWTFSADKKVRLACVGRLFPQEKGQDILLRVLSGEKWRQRNLEVSFFGKGINEQGLKDLAVHLGVKDKVRFKGHISDIDSIWKEYQALVLPSRTEGLPLVLVEAMLCARTAIVTNVGGNAEILDDDQTGFLAKSVDETGFDEALERAWQRRSEWGAIGKEASRRIRALVPSDPAKVLSDKLVRIIEHKN